MRFVFLVSLGLALLAGVASSCGGSSDSGSGGGAARAPAWTCSLSSTDCSCTFTSATVEVEDGVKIVDTCGPADIAATSLLCTMADVSHCACKPYACFAKIPPGDPGCRCDFEPLLEKGAFEEDAPSCDDTHCCVTGDGAACACSPDNPCGDGEIAVTDCTVASVTKAMEKRTPAVARDACPPPGDAKPCLSCGAYLTAYLKDHSADPIPLCGYNFTDDKLRHESSAYLFDFALGCACASGSCGSLCPRTCDDAGSDQAGCDECLTQTMSQDCKPDFDSCRADEPF